MSPYVVDLRALGACDAGLVGNKAANLAYLLAAGFPVPAGFCLPADVFHHALAPFSDQIHAALAPFDLSRPDYAAGAAQHIETVLRDLTVPDYIAPDLTLALEGLGGGPVSVRSSALAEDLAGASFAGQYGTVLDVRGAEAVLEAILTCWRSFYTAHAIAARARAGLRDDGGMAVLVQAMVDAECAGVCYSVDGVAGRRDLVVINAAWGAGAGVVDGSVPSDTYWLQRASLEVERRLIVEKPVRLAARAGGIHREAVAEQWRRAACLPDRWARMVGEAAVLTERHFGAPQDVEWAIAAAKLWVLQSRPMTGLPHGLQEIDPFPVQWDTPEQSRKRWPLWWECRDRIPFPLEEDYRDILIVQIWDDACRFVGEDRFRDSKIFNGRRYVSLRSGALGPGDLRVRKAAIEKMGERLLQEHGLTGWDVWGPEIVSRIQTHHDFDHRSVVAADLAAHLEDVMAAYRRHWMLHSPLMFNDPRTYFAAYAALTGKPEASVGEAAWRLAEGERTISSEMIDSLHTLGVEARKHSRVAELVRNSPADVRDRLAQMPEAGPFLSLLDAFLDRYGERNGIGRGSIGTPLTPTWGERRESVLALVTPYLDPHVPPPHVARLKAQEARDAEVERLCAACPDPEIVATFRRQLALARRLATVEETHNHYIDQISEGQLRLVTLEAARRLYASGTIDTPDDIWWLRCEEVLAQLRNSEPSSCMDVVRARQEEHARWERLIPPPVLGVPNADLPPRPSLRDEVTQEREAGDGAIRGQGGSSGRGSGPARVVAMGTLLPKLEPGDVLVAVNAGPAWTAYFPILAGVVLDEGSFAEHSTATAREYGVPVVFGTRDGSKRIPQGAWVTVDGTAGTVEMG